FGRISQKHADDGAHVRFHVDDENFLVISNEQRATAVGGKNPAYLNRHHVILHTHILGAMPENTSPAECAGGWHPAAFSTREKICSVQTLQLQIKRLKGLAYALQLAPVSDADSERPWTAARDRAAGPSRQGGTPPSQEPFPDCHQSQPPDGAIQRPAA